MHKLIHGECIQEMIKLKEGKVDLILCDLPYGTTACAWDEIIPFDKLWEQYKRVIKHDGAIVLTASQPFTSKLIVSNLKMFKYEWIWEKQKASNFMGAKYSPLKYHENICVFSINPHVYYPQKYDVLELEEILSYDAQTMRKLFELREYDRFGKIDKRKSVVDPATNKEHLGSNITRTRKLDDGSRFPKSVIKINKSINGNVHPTQKPVRLMEYLIKTYTSEGNWVLDNCMGSGTTGVACANTNRNFIGIEQDEKYFNIATERVNRAYELNKG